MQSQAAALPAADHDDIAESKADLLLAAQIFLWTISGQPCLLLVFMESTLAC